MKSQSKLLVCLTSVCVTLVISLLVGTGSITAQEADAPNQENATSDATEKDQADRESIFDQEPVIPPARQVYMGRRIARTMHYTGAEWLIRDEREREERCSMMLANLGVKPGMTVCDMGCGNGFHSLPIATMLKDSGLVIGVDVQPEMLDLLRERMEAKGIDNVIPILGSYHHPRLPPNQVDLLFMVDVYHEFSHPELMLREIRRSLKPSGLVVLVEYRKEDPKVPIKLLHKMSKAQIDKEMTANGFKLVKSFDGLPWQHMLFYGKADKVQSNSENGTDNENLSDNKSSAGAKDAKKEN